jgi:acyl-CoA thioesterase-1
MKITGLLRNFKLSYLVLVVMIGLASCSSDHAKFIIIIGDQNSAGENSWISQIDTMFADEKIVNFSVPGNTLGFDNLENPKLNSLKNIDITLDNALDSVNGRKIDCVILALGSNDCKRSFDNELTKVPDFLREIIRKINAFPGFKSRPPDILILSPLPFGADSLLPARYKGANERVKFLLPYYKDIAYQTRSGFIDIYSPLKQDLQKYSTDGFHLNDEAHGLIAEKVFHYIKNH